MVVVTKVIRTEILVPFVQAVSNPNQKAYITANQDGRRVDEKIIAIRKKTIGRMLYDDTYLAGNVDCHLTEKTRVFSNTPQVRSLLVVKMHNGLLSIGVSESEEVFFFARASRPTERQTENGAFVSTVVARFHVIVG